MGNVLMETFEDLMEERIHQVAYAKCNSDVEYRTANREAVVLMLQLRNALVTDEQKYLLSKLEEMIFTAEGIFLEYCYKQGLEDSSLVCSH